jgi:hypothetical protein
MTFPIQGHVSFSDVKFAYPSRPDVPILKGLTFDIQPGECVGVVGFVFFFFSFSFSFLRFADFLYPSAVLPVLASPPPLLFFSVSTSPSPVLSSSTAGRSAESTSSTSATTSPSSPSTRRSST